MTRRDQQACKPLSGHRTGPAGLGTAHIQERQLPARDAPGRLLEPHVYVGRLQITVSPTLAMEVADGLHRTGHVHWDCRSGPVVPRILLAPFTCALQSWPD